MTSKILMVSDPVCPWCMIGHHRLRKAAANLNRSIDLTFLPFELNPHMPAQGMKRKDYVTQKFGSHAQDFYANIRAQAAEDGLEMHFDKIAHMPATKPIHALMMWLHEHHPQKAEPVMLDLFRGFFQQGEDINDPDFLVQLLHTQELDHARAMQAIGQEIYSLRLAEYRQEFLKLGVSGVPFFIIDDQRYLPGAITTEAWQSLL